MVLVKKIISDSEVSDKERKGIDILDLVRKNGPIARTEISRLTGYNIVTVSNYVENYIKAGIVSEKGYDASSGGRRPVLVEMNPDAAYVIGVGMNPYNILGIIADIKTGVIHEVKSARPPGRSESNIDSLFEVTSKLLEKSQGIKDKIWGIGLGIPGIIDILGHTVRWPAGPLGVEDAFISVSIKEIFETKFNLPVLVKNDADCAVFGEKWLALSPEVKNMLYMYSGVSCGIMIDGKIYEGTTGVAGELGICNFEKQTPEEVTKDSYNIGRWDMELGILRQVKEKDLYEKNKNSAIYQLVNGDVNAITFNTIIDAIKAKDKFATELLEVAGYNLGRKIAFLVNLFNPEVVVIGGGIERAGVLLLDAVKKSVKLWALDEATRTLKIIPAQLGENAVALGAAALVIRNIYAQA